MKQRQFFCDLCNEWVPVLKCELHFRDEHAWPPEYLHPDNLADYFIGNNIEFRVAEVTNNE